MLAVARLDRRFDPHSARAGGARSPLLALFNITGWNGLVLFGVQQLPAGRSAILAYTMPMWSVLISLVAAARAAVDGARSSGLVLGMLGHGAAARRRHPHISSARRSRALLILGAAISWAFGTVLLRKWKLPLPQNTLSGWMMLLGWLPLAILAPFFAPRPLATRCRPRGVVRDRLQHLPRRHARALGVVHARAHAAGRGVVDVVAAGARSSACSPGCCLLGERPGAGEWVGAGARRRRAGRGAVGAETAARADGARRLKPYARASSVLGVDRLEKSVLFIESSPRHGRALIREKPIET